MRQVLIVSTDDILLYQPSILNLYDFLEKDFNVKIISFEPQYLGKKKELSRNVIYVSYSYMAKIYRFVDLIINAVLKRANKFFAKIKFRSQLIRAHKYRLLIKELKKHTSQHVIAVDLMSLCATQQVFVSAHFLSLELLQDDPYYKKINFNKILSVIIQNSDRYNYLFPKIFLKTFYIQNAPFHDNKCINNNPRNGLIWGGTVVKEFGVLFCLDFVRAYPEYKLELKGAVEKKTAQLISKKYGDLIESKKIAFNNTYLSIREFIHYLSNFEIGYLSFSTSY